MKKKGLAGVLCAVLAAAMLAGCGAESSSEQATVQEETAAQEEAETAQTQEVAEEDAAAQEAESSAVQTTASAAASQVLQVVEQIGEKGEEIDTVAYIPMATSNELFLTMTNAFVETLEAAGFTAEYTSPEFDPALQLEIFENYVTQGFDCIIVFPINADSMNDVVKDAREKGIRVICQVNQTEECDGWIGSSAVDMGIGTCQVAVNWVEEQFADAGAGEVKCAVITTRTDDNNSTISDEMEKIANYSDKIEVVNVVETTDTSIEAGQSLAENLYMTNPEVNLVIVEESDVAIGMNAYYSGVDSPLTDKDNFGIFCNNGGATTYDLMKGSVDNSDLLRGISSVAPARYGAQIAANIVIRLSNGEEGEVNFEPDPVYLVTPENVEEFEAANQ
ncbi:MAG: sugar ABC transporter substrate-binding protein [Eubacteriales bacterium]|nr:sugar ABC transporter substrate-binding protein [Eubacteriales bacterium]